MAGEADVILVPKADLEAMRKAAKQMHETLEKAAEQASNDVENDLKNGVKKGIKKGADEGFMGLSKKGQAAIASFSLSVGLVIKDSLEQTLGGADEYVAKIAERAQNIRDMMSGEKVFGIDEAQYAALTIGGKRLGIEPDDIRGVFEGLSAALDSPEMKAYKDVADKEGLDQAFFNLLMTAADKTPGEAQTWLATTAQMGDSDATFVNKYADVIRDMKKNGIEINRENFFNASAGFGINVEAIGHAMDKSRASIEDMRKGDAFREYKKLLAGVTPEQAKAYNDRNDSVKRLEDAHIGNITLKVATANFQDAVTIKQMKATVKTLNALSEGVSSLDGASKDMGTEGNAVNQIPKEFAQLGPLNMDAIWKQFKKDLTAVAKFMFILNTDAMEKDVRKFYDLLSANTPSKDHIEQTGHAYDSSDDK